MNPAEAQQKPINVQVAVRCRPPNAEEKKTNQPTVVSCESDAKQIKVNYGPAGKKVLKTFSFDRVFGMYSTQEEVFETMVRPIIDETLSGFNCTIFAYGQTGTGKTHTMEGNINIPEEAGIVPRSATAIIEQLEASGVEFTIRVSFLELYNEELQDLLTENNDSKGPLRLCEDAKKGGVVCQNLEEVTVLNARDIFDILQRGIRKRQTAETLMNKNSSRSHSIFTLKIMIKETNVEGEDIVRHGQLNLVDLAGSECVGRSGAKNDRAREAGSINQSLLTLGRVITALVDHHGHIPYRDSKLTRILQESLGGRAKTCIIATLSPSHLSVEESLSTLDYAHRAKNIKNRPEVNQKLTKKVLLKEYGAEIENLRLMLQLTREKNGVYVDPAQFDAMEARLASQESQLLECEAALKSRYDEVKQLRSEKEEMEESLRESQLVIEEKTEQLSNTSKELQIVSENLVVTQMELDATVAVVSEQVITENQLYTEGNTLMEIVTEHRNDIDLLHGKIQRHASMEEKRIKNATVFQAEVNSLQSNVAQNIGEMKQLTKTNTVNLCADVDTLLARGKETCQSLHVAIDGSLNILLADAGVAREKMMSSCDELQRDLRSTGSSVAETLNGLKLQLGNWINDLDANLAVVVTHLASQQQQIESLSNQLQESKAKHNDLTMSLIQNNKSSSLLTIDSINKDETHALNSISEFKRRQEAATKEQIELSKAKSSEMEKIFTAMLREMNNSITALIEKSAVDQSQFCDSFVTTASSSHENIKTIVLQQQSMITSEMENINCNIECDMDKIMSYAADVEESRLNSFNYISAMKSSVPEKHELLMKTTMSVISKIDEAVKSGCESAQLTSEMANDILSNVQDATQSMNKAAGMSISSFTEVMNGTGCSLQTKLGNHFADLNTFLEDQEKLVATTIDKTVEFKGFSDSSVVIPTGTTPRKQVYQKPHELSRTRDHEIIKTEAKNRKRKSSDEFDTKRDDVQIEFISRSSSSCSAEEGSENTNPQDEQSVVVSLKSSDSKRETGGKTSKPVRKASRTAILA